MSHLFELRAGLLCFASIAANTEARATPIQPSTNVAIINGPQSRILADNENARQLWVVPPTQGTIGSYSAQLAVTRIQCQTLYSAMEEQGEIQVTLRTLRARKRSLVLSFDEANANETEIAEHRRRLAALEEMIEEQQHDVDAFFAQQGSTIGGTVSVLYDTSWDEDVARIRALNPNFTVEPIRTANLRFAFVLPDSRAGGAAVEDLPLIRAFTVNGRSVDTAAAAGAGPMADHIQVDISLSRLGACYLKYYDLFGVDQEPKFSLTAFFDHPIAYRSSVDATYNYRSIYRYLSESGSSGGLFDSSSYSRTMESNWGNAAIDFHWQQTDPDNRMTADERLQLERAIKEDLLASVGRLAAERPEVAAIAPSAPGAHGAVVIAEGLERGCGPNPKCMAAALGFRALDAIFGSSSSSSEVERTVNLTGSYRSSSEDARMIPAGTVFTIR